MTAIGFSYDHFGSEDSYYFEVSYDLSDDRDKATHLCSLSPDGYALEAGEHARFKEDLSHLFHKTFITKNIRTTVYICVSQNYFDRFPDFSPTHVLMGLISATYIQGNYRKVISGMSVSEISLDTLVSDFDSTRGITKSIQEIFTEIRQQLEREDARRQNRRR